MSRPQDASRRRSTQKRTCVSYTRSLSQDSVGRVAGRGGQGASDGRTGAADNVHAAGWNAGVLCAAIRF